MIQITRSTCSRLYFGVLLALALAGCSEKAPVLRSLNAQPTAESTPTALPTPTLPPTEVPGSLADEQAVTQTVEQFATALARDNDLVALLVLSPSAQRIVAADSLEAVLGRAGRPQALTVHAVLVQQDIATVDCMARYPDAEYPLQLRLVRLSGVWKIDTLVER